MNDQSGIVVFDPHCGWARDTCRIEVAGAILVYHR